MREQIEREKTIEYLLSEARSKGSIVIQLEKTKIYELCLPYCTITIPEHSNEANSVFMVTENFGRPRSTDVSDTLYDGFRLCYSGSANGLHEVALNILIDYDIEELNSGKRLKTLRSNSPGFGQKLTPEDEEKFDMLLQYAMKELQCQESMRSKS